ncbi:ABC transporter permease, partial [Paenibacillus sepulcri]|nr:ABC transporter permease [Paenibacillus sepulcri]
SGAMSAKLNVAPFVATLAMMTIARGIALIYTNGRPIVVSSSSFKYLGQGYIGPIPVPVLIFVLITVIMAIILYKTKFGRYVYAIGGNENAAKISGIRVGGIKIWVYVINGFLAGLAGILLASRISSGQPNSGMGYELDAIAAVVIGGTSLFGGRGSLLGTIVGVLIIGVINNGLNLMDVSSYWQQIIKGLIIAGAVILDQRAKRQ